MPDVPPSSSWVSAHLHAGQSPIDGTGLFAATDLDEGEVVVRLGGRIVSDGELRNLLTDANSRDSYVDTIGLRG